MEAGLLEKFNFLRPVASPYATVLSDSIYIRVADGVETLLNHGYKIGNDIYLGQGCQVHTRHSLPTSSSSSPSKPRKVN